MVSLAFKVRTMMLQHDMDFEVNLHWKKILLHSTLVNYKSTMHVIMLSVWEYYVIITKKFSTGCDNYMHII